MLNRQQLLDALDIINQLIKETNQRVTDALEEAEKKGVTELVRQSPNQEKITVKIRIIKEDGPMQGMAAADAEIVIFFADSVIEEFRQRANYDPAILPTMIAGLDLLDSLASIITSPIPGVSIALRSVISDNVTAAKISKEDADFVLLTFLQNEIEKFHDYYRLESQADQVLQQLFEITDRHPDYAQEIDWAAILNKVRELQIEERITVNNATIADFEFYSERIKLKILESKIYQFDEKTQLADAANHINSLLEIISSKPNFAAYVNWEKIFEKTNPLVLSEARANKELKENNKHIRILKNLFNLYNEIKNFNSSTPDYEARKKLNDFFEFLNRDKSYLVYIDFKPISNALKAVVKDRDPNNSLIVLANKYQDEITEKFEPFKNEALFNLAMSNLQKCLNDKNIDPAMKQCAKLAYDTAYGAKPLIPKRYLPKLTQCVQGVTDAMNNKNKAQAHFDNTIMANELKLGNRQWSRFKYAMLAVGGALICAAAIAVGAVFLPAGVAGLALGLTLTAVAMSALVGVSLTIGASVKAEKENEKEKDFVKVMGDVDMVLKKK